MIAEKQAVMREKNIRLTVLMQPNPTLEGSNVQKRGRKDKKVEIPVELMHQYDSQLRVPRK